MREWLMNLVAGKQAYWISNKAAATLQDFSGTSVANGAVVALCLSMDRSEFTSATFTLEGWEVTVRKTGGDE